MKKMIYSITLLIVLIPMIGGSKEFLQDSLAVGDVAQDFTLPNAIGGTRSLSDFLKQGPVVLTFYRGGWCPVCNRQLRELQQHLPKIQELGANLVAVSPEIPTESDITQTKNKLDFEVLSDTGNVVARQYGITWEVPEEDRQGFASWLKETTGKTLEDYNARPGYELPVPATFVIQKDGRIAFAFKDIDYRKRANPEEILKTLERIKAFSQ